MIQIFLLVQGVYFMWRWADTSHGIYLAAYVVCWSIVAIWRFLDEWGSRLAKKKLQLETNGATNETHESPATVDCAEAIDRGGGAADLPPDLLAAHREILRLRPSCMIYKGSMEQSQRRNAVLLYHIVQNMPIHRYCPATRNDKIVCAMDQIDPKHGMDRFSACMDCLTCNFGSLPQPGKHPDNGHAWSPTKEPKDEKKHD